MSTEQSRRRQLIAAATGIGVAALVSGPASAQERVGISFNKFVARDAGIEHRARLGEISKALNGKAPVSPDGMALLVDFLVRLEVLRKEDAERLKKLVKAIFEAPALDKLVASVNDISKELTDKAEDLTVAIIAIARDSIEYAKTVASGLPMHVVTRIVAADMQGALSGAEVGAKLGGKAGALFGAVAGAVAMSAAAL